MSVWSLSGLYLVFIRSLSKCLMRLSKGKRKGSKRFTSFAPLNMEVNIALIQLLGAVEVDYDWVNTFITRIDTFQFNTTGSPFQCFFQFFNIGYVFIVCLSDNITFLNSNLAEQTALADRFNEHTAFDVLFLC